jgi:ABC-type hemin transport system ATPase subunit
LGLRARAILIDDPTAAMDVDRLEHVAMAEAVIADRKGAGAAQRP